MALLTEVNAPSAWNDILVTSLLNLTNLHNEALIPRSGEAQFFRLTQSQ